MPPQHHLFALGLTCGPIVCAPHSTLLQLTPFPPLLPNEQGRAVQQVSTWWRWQGSTGWVTVKHTHCAVRSPPAQQGPAPAPLLCHLQDGVWVL